MDNPEVKYYSEKIDGYLCFRHAVLRALQGDDIEPEIDEFGADGLDMRDTHCHDCRVKK